ncbi:uncharacterized protein LOC143783206 [Ranitomeya variabilis]|uniref:uncharacterized protein LOC143783206 n=1 Tax=Ranitomeya variabilis TaxID=490064 RepID=UPI004057B759
MPMMSAEEEEEFLKWIESVKMWKIKYKGVVFDLSSDGTANLEEEAEDYAHSNYDVSKVSPQESLIPLTEKRVLIPIHKGAIMKMEKGSYVKQRNKNKYTFIMFASLNKMKFALVLCPFLYYSGDI